jgi:N6-L-threonylcarbamoyladenine synthase
LLILGIESSCDETGLALYDTEKGGLLAQRIHSQIDMHKAYGGVVPELASRDHIRRVVPLTREVLAEAGRKQSDINLIAYTEGPGLGGALLVGASFCAGLALAIGCPTVGIHHLEGHLLSPLLADPRPDFPFIALLVSGGHTQLMAVQGVGQYQLLGETLDDACGEAFDKTATLLGLSYPGGPALSALAAQGRTDRFTLPRPLLHSGDLNFSFSGLKTAVATLIQREKLSAEDFADVAASFQEAVVDVLVAKSLSACAAAKANALVVAGGVGANKRLRERLTLAGAGKKVSVYYPPMALCTDNGAMIAFAAALRVEAGLVPEVAALDGFSVRPRWPLTAVCVG